MKQPKSTIGIWKTYQGRKPNRPKGKIKVKTSRAVPAAVQQAAGFPSRNLVGKKSAEQIDDMFYVLEKLLPKDNTPIKVLDTSSWGPGSDLEKLAELPQNRRFLNQEEEIDPVHPRIRVFQTWAGMREAGDGEFKHVVLSKSKALRLSLYFLGNKYFLLQENFITLMMKQSLTYTNREQLMSALDKQSVYWKVATPLTIIPSFPSQESFEE